MKAKKKSSSIISNAARRFLRASWDVHDHSLWAVVHGYIYTRWPYLYIGIGKGDHPIAKKLTPLRRLWKRLRPTEKPKEPLRHSSTQATGTVADGYHAKVTPLDQACQLVTINQPIEMPDLEQVIPYTRARALILQNPDQIVVMVCPCRAAMENPCQPLDVCLVIGEPFVSLMLEYHPSRSRRITQEEAVKILEREDERGRVHHAFFNDPMLGRFFGICNCCSCCCAAMRSHRNGTPMLASSGYLAQVDEDECTACGTCERYCQFSALGLDNGSNLVDPQLCMGCGVCVSKCPQGALSLQRDPSKGLPLEIHALMEAQITNIKLAQDPC
jgi:ferredoxin